MQQAAPVLAPPPSATPTANMVAAPPVQTRSEAPPARGGKYEPLTTGGDTGIMPLMRIPIPGQILSIVWACGGCRKINKRSPSRSVLIFLVISMTLGVIAYAERCQVAAIPHSFIDK